jgi:quinol monooxygenase YgiN
MIAIKATIPIKPDERDRAIELMSELGEKSRAEDGVIDYRVATDIDDPNTFRALEQYEDEETFNRHLEADHTQKMIQELPDLLAGELEMRRLDVESAADFEL